jgi:hypothetical protein
MEKEMVNKVSEIINDFKNHSNNDLILAMDVINKEFESTKQNVINLTYHLDNLENTYNTILKEYKKRTNT